MATRVSSLTFIGRRGELDEVTAALDLAREGRSALIVVAGEAGVGKTRFVQEVGGRARSRGFRVLAGGCVQLGGEGLPFGPIIEALRGLGDAFPPAQLDDLLGASRADLARLVPSFRPADQRQPEGRFDPYGQGSLFEHLLLLLGRLGRLQPVALVVEDIHWADRSTLELLDFLVRNLHEGPIVLVATYRSDELHRRHPLLPLLASLERGAHATRLELTRFSRRELTDQMEGILGDEPDPDLVDAIFARSDGNAFFAEELLASGSPQGRFPDTLSEVLVERVATLSEPTQELVRVASAAGPRIRVPLLATVSDTDEAGLLPSLREAVARHVLVPEDGGVDDAFVFRHALVQEAVYRDLLAGERSRLHAAFALALEDERRVVADWALTAELAYHWQAAQDLPRALDAWIRAGMAAEAIHASAEAQAYFERALELWDRVPDAGARAPVDRVELLVHAAAAAEGRAPSRSAAYLRTAITLVDDTIDPTRAGLLYERLGQYTSTLVQDRDALAAYREAVRLAPAEPPSAARALVLAGLGQCLFYLHRWQESAAVCQEALRVAGAVGERRVESKAMAVLGSDLAFTGDVYSGMAHIRRAREIAAAVGDVSAVALAMSIGATVLLECGRYADALTAGLEAEDHAVRHGLAARFGVGVILHAALALISLGRWDEANAALERAQLYYPSHQKDDIEACLLLLEALQGRFPSATRRAARIRPPSPDTIDRQKFAGLAELALWQGDPLPARETIRSAVAILDSEPQPRISQLGRACSLGIRAEADLADLARARGAESDLEDARTIGGVLLARMRALAEEVAARRPFFKPRADAFLETCQAEWSRVDGASDPNSWARAAAAWDGFEMPYLRAYALMREGQAALAGDRDRPRASIALGTGLAIAVRLGAEPLRRSIEALAVRAGDTGTPSPRMPGRARGLTPRELDVLRLVAAGRSDGEIAERLFISKKTASVHVANIKGKLGARSRVEIATGAVGLGLASAPPLERAPGEPGEGDGA